MARHRAPRTSRVRQLARLALLPVRLPGVLLRLSWAIVRGLLIMAGALVWSVLTLALAIVGALLRHHGGSVRNVVTDRMVPVVRPTPVPDGPVRITEPLPPVPAPTRAPVADDNLWPPMAPLWSEEDCAAVLAEPITITAIRHLQNAA